MIKIIADSTCDLSDEVLRKVRYQCGTSNDKHRR